MCLVVFHRQLSPAVFYGRPDRHSCYGLTFSLIGDNVQLFIFSQRISFRHKMFPGINSMIIYPMQRTCPAKCDVRYHRASALVQTLPCLAAYLPFPFALPGVRQGPGGSIVKKEKTVYVTTCVLYSWGGIPVSTVFMQVPLSERFRARAGPSCSRT